MKKFLNSDGQAYSFWRSLSYPIDTFPLEFVALEKRPVEWSFGCASVSQLRAGGIQGSRKGQGVTKHSHGSHVQKL